MALHDGASPFLVKMGRDNWKEWWSGPDVAIKRIHSGHEAIDHAVWEPQAR